jgi:hypothetical protein
MTEELKPYIISVVTTNFYEIYLKATDDSQAMKMAKDHFKSHQISDPEIRMTNQLIMASDKTLRH